DLARITRATQLGDHADAWLHLGIALRDAGRMKESEAAFDKVEERPNMSNGFYRPAQIEAERITTLIAARRRPEALERARALASHPGSLSDAILPLARLEAWDDIVSYAEKE